MVSWFKDIKLSEFKNLEIQFEFLNPNICTEWFVFNLSTRSKQDHWGVGFTFELLRLVYFNINLYDGRHYDENTEY